MPDYEIKTGDRDALIAGLRELADFLMENPGVLTPSVPSIGVCVTADDPAARFEGAKRAAESLGVSVDDVGEGYYSGERRFGSIRYYVVAVPPKEQQ